MRTRYVWTRIFLKMLRSQKYPDTCGRSERPCLHESGYFWKRRFFSVFKKYLPTRSVFQSFSPVHTKKLNNGNMIISLTGHVLYDVRDHVLKISVFVRLDKNDNWAFSKIPILGTVFIKLRFWFPCGRKARKEQKVYPDACGQGFSYPDNSHKSVPWLNRLWSS